MLAKHHSYSSDSSSRQLVHVYLAVIGTALAYLLYVICAKYSISIAWWIEAPSIFGFYGLLYWLFNECLWKITFIRFIFQIKTPNWNGIYKGQLTTSHDNFKQAIPFELEIVQKWSKIILTGRTANSTSNSFLGFFSEEETTSPELIYQYLNQPKTDAVSTMNIHRGVAQIYFEKDLLVGDFFNGRGRNTIGKFELKRQSE